MNITEFRLRQVTGTLPTESPFWEERLIQPIDIYPEYKERRRGEMAVSDANGLPVSSIFLEVHTDEGIVGLAGPTSPTVAHFIGTLFGPLLIGEDPLANERCWDLMYRHAVHGRKGEAMFAISVIDCALWDLKGKVYGAPVCQLLGGPVRKSIPAYASMLGYSIEPKLAAERAKAFTDAGYIAQKWFVRNGPTDGPEGIRKNIELVETLRDAIGDDNDLMIDAWMSWDVPYTVKMADLLDEYHLRWIEEPVMPDKITQYAQIRERVTTSISGGEHEYTRWGINELLAAEGVDLLQADTYWAGGITEMQKIYTLASVYDIPVIPHGHSIPANAHLSLAHNVVESPMIEYLDKWNAIHQHFFVEPIKPVNGLISVPDRPGMGVELDPEKIETETVLTF